MISEKKVFREKPIPEGKKKEIEEILEKISKNRTLMFASCKSLPGKQFHEIKKKLRGVAEMKVSKKSAIIRSIDQINKGSIKNLKNQIGPDIVVLFSDLDPFELSGLLSENKSSRKARPGDIAPEDIKIEPGPTELPPGPAISELGSVGLKVSVKDGKLEIMTGATIAKKGSEIKATVASVLGKLNVSPIEVGFTPIVAYDSKEDKTYLELIIDKEGTLKELRILSGKALGFAVSLNYPAKETISYFISKAVTEEKILEKLVGKSEEDVKNTQEIPEEKTEKSDSIKQDIREEN